MLVQKGSKYFFYFYSIKAISKLLHIHQQNHQLPILLIAPGYLQHLTKSPAARVPLFGK